MLNIDLIRAWASVNVHVYDNACDGLIKQVECSISRYLLYKNNACLYYLIKKGLTYESRTAIALSGSRKALTYESRMEIALSAGKKALIYESWTAITLIVGRKALTYESWTSIALSVGRKALTNKSRMTITR